MATEDQPSKAPITVFRCGGDECPGGGEHQWDGPTVSGTQGPNQATWESATCSKCALDMMSWSMMNMP